MPAVGHLDEGVREVSLAGLLLHEPHLVETLPADASAQVSVELDEDNSVVSQQPAKGSKSGRGEFWTPRYTSKRVLSVPYKSAVLTSILGRAM